ncbi:MAG: sigma-70 family RNA polymerase sigma factor [Actinomycetia bacterium]|nr:sigma-70 family RNA polymerase sigma factor [Actinomycetes bacterium]
MSTPPPDLDDIVDGIRERSDEAFSDLHRVMAGRLLTYANGMLRDRQAAEDSVQQAFVELARTAGSLRGDGTSLRSWLYRSVRFNCLDEVRRRKRHPELPTEVLPDAGLLDDDPDLGLDPELEAALDELSEQQRSIVMLKHVLGFSGDEIASILNTNRAAVYASAARAERRLKKLLTPVKSSIGAASQRVEDRP